MVIRKSSISDDIVHKQTFLINKMKQDNTLIKKMLEVKNCELNKVKLSLEHLQLENISLNTDIDQLKSSKSNYEQN